MDRNLLVNVMFSFGLLLIGLMFIEGIWKKKGTVIKTGFNVDSFFFPDIKDKRLLKAGDQLAFLICALMSLFTLINGLLFLVSEKIQNVSAIFMFVAVVLSWPTRIFFIYSIKNRNYDDLPRIWPFKKG